MLSVNELFREEKSISEYIREDIEKRDKQIEELKNMNLKERQFRIFKMSYDGLSKSTEELLQAAIKKYPSILNKTYPLIYEAREANYLRRDSIYNREEVCHEIITKYNALLKKISMLAEELNINNSLELSILFSYLLWNGYLSKDKKYIFQSEGRNNIVGMLFTDIMNGIGVCLNHAEMLKDILNHCGYKSTIILNHFDYYTKVKKVMDIKRSSVKERKNIFKELNKNKSNHVFTLVEEDDKLYIYDSTNLLLYDIVDSNYASLVNGKGKNKLFLYQSYGYCITDEDTRLLDKLFETDIFISPYTIEDFTRTSDVNIEIIKNSQSLLEDFYSEARQDIVSIAEETNKMVKKRIK